jgi:hypothetical protein
MPDQEARDLARLLQIPADKKLDPARAFQLLTLLVDVALKLDQAVWGSWAQIEPTSDLRRNMPLQRAAARFLTGESNRQQVQQDADRLLKLGASLIVSLQKIGPGLFRTYFDPASPSTIKEQITEWSITKSKEVRWWERYEKVAGQMDATSFNAALHAAVARFVRDFFHPGGPPAPGAADAAP